MSESPVLVLLASFLLPARALLVISIDGSPATDQGKEVGAASLEKIIAGSTAEGVIKAADCSVLIVKPPHSAAQHPQWQSSHGKRY